MLVTGGTGVVGQSVVEALVRGGGRVRVLSRSERPPKFAGAVEFRAGDILKPECVRDALEGVSTVIHAAGARSGDAAALWRTNVNGTRVLAREAKRARVARFIHVSSAAVYGDSDGEPFGEGSALEPADAYGCSKLEGERVLAAEFAGGEIAWTILRPFGVYGPHRLDFFREVRKRRVWLYGWKRVLVHPTYVEDVVAAIVLTLERIQERGVSAETFNVAGERALEHFEYVRLIADRLGVPAYRVAIPAWLEKATRPLASVAPPILSQRLLRRTVSRIGDTSKATRCLGFRPIPIDAGIEATVAAALANDAL